jgi:hypothetical protein
MSLQPFFIGGPFKTGLYDYLEKWLSPDEAFEPCDNAFVYRGVIQKRLGYEDLGKVTYRESALLFENTSGGDLAAYSGTFDFTGYGDRRANATTIIVKTKASGVVTLTQDGNNMKKGATVVGTFNNTTGAFSLDYATIADTIEDGFKGYVRFVHTPTADTAITGIHEHIDSATNISVMLICDENRACYYNATTESIDPVFRASEQIGIGGGGAGPYTFTCGFHDIAPYSFTLTDSVESFSDNGSGVLTGDAGGTGTINYSTGVYIVTFNAGTSAKFVVTYEINGDIFTGDFRNLINFENWNDLLYLANNNDPITTFNGSTLARQPIGITKANVDAYVNDITTALSVLVFKNRLVLIRPNENSVVQGVRVSYSKINNPTNFAYDIAGNGGYIDAPTGEWIKGAAFQQDTLICPFAHTLFNLRYTGNQIEPFRFEQQSASTHCYAPYAIQSFDSGVTFVGQKGYMQATVAACQRFDLNIPTYVTEQVELELGSICFAQKFDAFNQLWTLHVSNGSTSTTPDKALVYNYLENTWATFSVPFTCLGVASVTQDLIWDDCHEVWDEMDWPWDYALYQEKAHILAAGDATGHVYKLFTSATDNGESFNFNIASNQWNPFVKEGKRIHLAYLDIFYKSNAGAAVTIDFYVDSSETPALTRTCTLTASDAKDYGYKRVYANLIGNFVKIKIYLSEEQLADSSVANHQVAFNGFVLHAEPAGRMG